MKKDPVYETERLYFRPTNEEDAAFILELLNSPKWIENIGDRNVKTQEEAKAYIMTKMRPQQERLGFSNYTVIRKSDSIKIGTCGLYDREGLEGVDIGFAFLSDYEKKGYAFESAQKVKDLAFNTFNIERISAITLETNKPSQRLIKKLGFEFVKMIQIPNDEKELMLFVIEKR